MHEGSLQASLTTPFWDELTKKNEKLSHLVSHRKFSNKIAEFEKMYIDIWRGAAQEPKDIASLAAFFCDIFSEMKPKIKNCEARLSDISDDIKYFIGQFSDEKIITDTINKVMADIHKTIEHMENRHKTFLDLALRELEEIKKFRALLVPCRAAADAFGEALNKLKETPSLDQLDSALDCGDNYHSKVNWLYSYMATGYFPNRAIFYALVGTCLKHRLIDHWVDGFSRYRVSFRGQWKTEIANMRAPMSALRGDTTDAHIIRVVTGPAVKNVARVEAFSVAVHEIWQKSFVC